MPRLYVTYTDPDTDERRVAEVETVHPLAVYRAEAFVYGVLLGTRAVAPWLVRGVSSEAPSLSVKLNNQIATAQPETKRGRR